MVRNFLTNIYWLVFAGLFFLFPLSGILAQSKNVGIETEKVEVEKAISYTNQLINETQVKKQATLSDLSVLTKKIILRKSLIETLDLEKKHLYDTIFEKLAGIDRINSEFILMKAEYAKMIRSAYKNRNLYQRLLYILASEDFGQAYRRLNYFKIYASERQKQADYIGIMNERLAKEVQNLMEKIERVEETLVAVSKEKQKLVSEKELKNDVVDNLIKKEKELISTQKKYQQQAAVLKSKIEQSIHEENMDGADNASGKTNPSAVEAVNKNLSENFTSNRGKLPWPVEKGVVSSEYGEHIHPEMKGIKLKNNGINIVAALDEKVRAVFEGEVTRVMVVPGFNNVVILRHGEYLSVYSNLDKVLLKKGDKVSAGQEVGTIFAPVDKQKAELHFEIWKGKNQLNPSDWLSPEKKP